MIRFLSFNMSDIISPCSLRCSGEQQVRNQRHFLPKFSFKMWRSWSLFHTRRQEHSEPGKGVINGFSWPGLWELGKFKTSLKCPILCRVTLKTNLINTSPLSGTVLKSAKGELEFIKNSEEITHICPLRLNFTLLHFNHPIRNYLVSAHNYAEFKPIPPPLLISSYVWAKGPDTCYKNTTPGP